MIIKKTLAKPDQTFHSLFTVESQHGGSFSTVIIVKMRGTGEKVALKCASDVNLPMLQHELACLLKVQGCPNIISLKNNSIASNSIFLEAARSDLYTYVVSRQKMPIPEAMRVFRQCVNAVKGMHAKSLGHFDIKPENYLVFDSDQVKICDFGFAKTFGEKIDSTYQGTRWYRPPEHVLGLEVDDNFLAAPAWDMFSLGCLLYELLTREALFPVPEEENILYLYEPIIGGLSYENLEKKCYAHCLKSVRKINQYDRECFEIGLKPFLMNLLSRDPDSRMSAETAMVHLRQMKKKFEMISEVYKFPLL